ncbi:Uncharacterized protein ALO43_05004 [Pseudomonas tremae]|uniref:Uncharacterized protein n=2 Tax=Pseudomonas syringae group TaxID=136849 RepID=A0AA40P5H3_9PSED|nr:MULTISPECIES: hypothetical protein [Pseudomonas syringae group]KOP53785.1 hypothetical protein OX88_19670 [Pseudomonas coronafaciens pv. porri]KOP60375.1 hypothetical protein OX90_06375 [Pseudomonas coronafaciens pv. porri]KPY20811.1 Uncharacterized protein ALO89_02871 [Pseudomonas coronafaciens pv. porri]KPZ02958.1 Uncharacterized protein ALO43_05004 [Pseudomonas tremae]MCF5802961.1 hypothetical protein [Pseudomonas tremae]
MKHENTMNTADNLHYIATCELAECPPSLTAYSAARKPELLLADDLTDSDPGDEPAKGAVVASSLLAFAEGMSRQSKEDVMDSFLFATLVANKAFNPETQGNQWYDKFNEVLSRLGWLSTHWNYARYHAAQQRFSMDEVGLEILASAVTAAALPGPASLLMLKVAADALAALKAKKEPLRLFESQAKSHRGGSFRVASCMESADKIVILAMGAVSFKTDSEVTNVLFWEWQDTHVETWKGEDNLVLNAGLYSRHRDLIQQRLGDNAKSAIEEFEI